MKRALLVAVLVGLCAAPAEAAAPSRLLVESREFNLVLSRGSVRAGDAIVQLANRGEDPHDLRLRRVGGRGGGSVGETLPGEVVRVGGAAAAWALPALVHARRPSRFGYARGPARALNFNCAGWGSEGIGRCAGDIVGSDAVGPVRLHVRARDGH